jgi:hypothetical protein
MSDPAGGATPKDFDALSDGVSWQKALGAGDLPGPVISGLLHSAFKALQKQFAGRAVARLDQEGVTVMVTLRIPEPGGRTKVCDAAVMLLVQSLTKSGDGATLVVIPRIRVEIVRLQDDLRWLAPNTDADVEQLTGEILDALDTVTP